MDWIKDKWYWLLGAVGTIIGGLVYYLTLKNREVKTLKAKIEMTDTKSKAVEIENEIQQKREKVKGNKKEIKELDRALEEVREKKKDLMVSDKDPKKVEDFWNKS